MSQNHRLHPTSDFIIIEPYKDVAQSLILPDNVKGELYRVLDIGTGFITNQGKRIKPEVKVNDIVAIVGNILTVPFQGEQCQIARSGDVIAYYRPERYATWKEEVPDKI